MKRTILFILFVLIFLASMGVGYFYLNTRDDQKKESKADENIENSIEEKTITIETSEEKISPNAQIIETIYYKKCGHSKSETLEIPDELVNMTEEEFKEKYSNWDINYFSSKEISIYQELDENCQEHYIIGTDNGQINIYRINKDGEEELYESTNIYLEYLPEKDQQDLANRIEVLGRKNLNEVLENFE